MTTKDFHARPGRIWTRHKPIKTIKKSRYYILLGGGSIYLLISARLTSSEYCQRCGFSTHNVSSVSMLRKMFGGRVASSLSSRSLHDDHKLKSEHAAWWGWVTDAFGHSSLFKGYRLQSPQTSTVKPGKQSAGIKHPERFDNSAVQRKPSTVVPGVVTHPSPTVFPQSIINVRTQLYCVMHY